MLYLFYFLLHRHFLPKTVFSMPTSEAQSSLFRKYFLTAVDQQSPNFSVLGLHQLLNSTWGAENTIEVQTKMKQNSNVAFRYLFGIILLTYYLT